MWSVLALGATEKLLNRIIDLDQISRIKLNELAGQMLRLVIDSPQLSIDVYFDQDKLRLEPTALGQATTSSIFEQRPFDPQDTVLDATATLHVADLVSLVKLLTAQDDSLGNIPLQGDYHLLFKLKEIFASSEIDVAAHLSPWIGATLAHELGKLQSLPKHVLKIAKSAEFILSDHLKEDSGLFASRWEMQEMQQQTRTLNQNIDRVDARLQQLLQRLAAD